MISIENVGVQKGGRWLVRGVDWKLIPGRFHIILGPNGAGKSTLLRTLSGQFPPSEGAIYWDELPLDRIPHPERHRAVLSQMHQLHFPLSVREVVELGAFPFRGQPGAAERRHRMEEAMVKFELTELANRNVQTLSGGEQQRVHFARAWLQIGEPNADRSKLLLIDEPTNFLDLRHQWAYMKELKESTVRHGWITVAVLHDLSLAYSLGDRLLLINDGYGMYQGTPREVLSPEHVARYFGVQSEQMGERLLVYGAV